MNNPLRTPEDYELFLYTLTSHPHHKHVPPGVKHNRIPAPEMSFTRPNLPVLIRETEALLKH
jgi:hypothetical protein